MAGLAGAAGASLAPLLQPVTDLKSEDTTPVLSSAVYAAGGFGLAAATYLLARSLLFDSQALSQVNRTGVFAFGGLVGLIAGRGLAGLAFLSSGLRGRLLGKDGRPAVLAALGGLEDRLFGRSDDNYDGFVLAAWYPSPQGDVRSVGTIRVQLQPRLGPDQDFRQSRIVGLPGEKAPVEPATFEAGRVLVQGGRDVEVCAFAVSVSAADLDAYPSRVQLHAPIDQPSQAVEFRVVRRPEGGDAASEISTALIDVSQQGRTIQLLELRLTT
jgi:hypothetical protein